MYTSYNAIYYSQMAGKVRRGRAKIRAQLMVEEDPQHNPLNNDDHINTDVTLAGSSPHVC